MSQRPKRTRRKLPALPPPELAAILRHRLSAFLEQPTPKHFPWAKDNPQGSLSCPPDRPLDELIEALAREIQDHVRALIPEPLRAAVLARPEVASEWPIPGTWHGYSADSSWPLEAAPGPVIRWASDRLDLQRFSNMSADGQQVAGPLLKGDETVSALEAAAQIAVVLSERGIHFAGAFGPPGLRGAAVLYLAERAVLADREAPWFAVDAGKTHHRLVVGMSKLPSDPRVQIDAEAVAGNQYRIELLPRGEKGKPQLALLVSQGLHEAALLALRRIGRDGIRNWAALLVLLSVDGGRRGWVRWTLDAHMNALGYSERAKRDPKVRAAVAHQIELWTQLELVTYSDDGKERTRAPLLHVGNRYERVSGSEWGLEGMELRINELLYTGVRDPKTGKLGLHWFPGPTELAQVNHKRFPYATGLGLVLLMRWRWALSEGRDHLVLQGHNLLNLAGISFQEGHPGRAWATLARELEELRRIRVLDRYEWTDGGPNRGSMCRLYPAPGLLDLAGRRIEPAEERPPVAVPLTGNELRRWRQDRALSQRVLSARLGVSQSLVSRAELCGDESLPGRVLDALRSQPPW